jgi:energy-coupling factor transporter ATP-binding protein EcfA2
MKITKISLQNFRAYEEPFVLDLDSGKNLLLHGENGAGKSSLYFALRRFFEERGGMIADHRNRFADSSRGSFVRLHIKGPDSTGTEHDQDVWWDDTDGHPLTVPKDPATQPITKELRALLVDAARRSGFLDYRALLKTNLLAKPLPRTSRDLDIHNLIYGADREGPEAQLFDVVTWVILDGVRVTTAGGGESTIGNLIREVWRTRPADRYKRTLRRAENATTAFNQAFAAVLPELEKLVSEFLDYFDKHDLTVKFAPVSIQWSKTTLALDGAVLIPEITFRKTQFDEPHLDLNEARLSALAICLFLAGVRLSDNDYANPAHPRFLFLDDALIGLELQNRLPILHILAREEFKHYQVFLFTHDRVWFDLARGHLPEKDGWLHKELLADEDTGRLVPKLRASESDLDRAKLHLGNGDLKAAAVYARSAFEWKLRKVCEKYGIKVPFNSDADKIGAGVLWDGIIQRQREREAHRQKGSQVDDFVPANLETAVETMRSTVLNKLSHTGSSGLVGAEVATAIQTVEVVHNHPFPKA